MAPRPPSLVNAQAGATDAGGAWSYTCQTPEAAGRVFVVHIIQDGATTTDVAITGATNIESLTGSANTWTSIRSESPVGSGPILGLATVLIGRATSTSAPTVSGTNVASEDLYFRSYQYVDVRTGSAPYESSDNAAGTSATVADTGITTFGPDRVCLNFVALTDDNVISAFSGETGGKWVLAVTPYAESSGTDAALGLQTAWICSIGTGPKADGGSASVLGTGGVAEERASSFVTGGSALSITYVYLDLSKTGTPTDNLIAEIQTDSGGSPSGTVVGTGVTIAGSSLGTTPRTIRYALTASLSASTNYHIVFRRSGTRDASNYYNVAYAGDVLSGQMQETRSNGTWVDDVNTDLTFGLLTDSDLTGGTIDGGSFTQSDGTDGWGVASIALLPTNREPYAPTLSSPGSGATIDPTTTQTFQWTFSDPDAGDTQGAWALKRSAGGGNPQTKFASSEVELDVAGTDWDHYTNALVEDGNVDSVTLAPSVASQNILWTDFDFAIPSDATIVGVIFQVKKSGSAGGGIVDDQVLLYYNGSPITADYGDTQNSWPATLTWTVVGEPGSLWGATLTPTIINSATFGACIGAYNSFASDKSATIDAAKLSVYFSGGEEWWNATTEQWVTSQVWNTGSSGSYQFPANTWTPAGDYGWTVATKDQDGYIGPYATYRSVIVQSPTILSHMQAPFMSRQAAIRASRW